MPAGPQCTQLLKRVTELEALVRDHQERLNQNLCNPSIPPSANPLGAPKRVVRVPSGRSPGGQKGHPGHHRHRLPSERVNKIVPYRRECLAKEHPARSTACREARRCAPTSPKARRPLV
ncbi:MAG: DUF6444 domain-containing protein [Isosphaeraceae bacterium]